jgi:hypothetical protein
MFVVLSVQNNHDCQIQMTRSIIGIEMISLSKNGIMEFKECPTIEEVSCLLPWNLYLPVDWLRSIFTVGLLISSLPPSAHDDLQLPLLIILYSIISSVLFFQSHFYTKFLQSGYEKAPQELAKSFVQSSSFLAFMISCCPIFSFIVICILFLFFIQAMPAWGEKNMLTHLLESPFFQLVIKWIMLMSCMLSMRQVGWRILKKLLIPLYWPIEESSHQSWYSQTQILCKQQWIIGESDEHCECELLYAFEYTWQNGTVLGVSCV